MEGEEGALEEQEEKVFCFLTARGREVGTEEEGSSGAQSSSGPAEVLKERVV